MELAEIAARAAGENFPVGSVLFPRPLRPHIRALYCSARLVDEHGGTRVEVRLSRGGVVTEPATADPDQTDLDHLASLLRGEGVELVFAEGGEAVLLVDSVDALPVVPGCEALRYAASDGRRSSTRWTWKPSRPSRRARRRRPD